MKRNYFFLLLGLITLWSCQSNEDLLPLSDSLNQISETRSDSEEAVVAQIMASRYGGYDKLRPNTRALEDFTLTPYVEEGDTLLYIAQYPEGWELYTAKTPLPMLVLSCEEGTFNIFDPEMPDPVRASLDVLITELKESEISASATVMASSENLQANDNLKSDVFVINPDNSIMAFSESDLPPGEWVLISVKDVNHRTYTSPKLIETQWGDFSPWNAYSKWVTNSNSLSLVQASAGCGPVALGQYTYYTHYKDGIPKFAPATVKQTSDGLDYTFPLLGANVWDYMALNKSSVTGFKEVAMLIGWIGREVNSTYGVQVTKTTATNILAYLKDTYSKEFTTTNYSFETIKGRIDNSYPVMTSAKYTPSVSGDTHIFLVDQYTEIQSDIEYVYGWKRKPLAPGVTDIWEHDLVDKDGNIIKYAYQKTVIEPGVYKTGVSMNWGWNGQYDNITFYDLNSWNPNGNNYQYFRTVFIPK